MADDTLVEGLPTLDPTANLMPFDTDDVPDGVRALEFLYLGQALTAADFVDYVATYDFGTIPPDFVVLHHSAIPGTRFTGAADGGKQIWDAGEDGLGEAAIRAHRLKGLEALRDFYKNTKKWDRGPHLYIDDRYIWLFTPMRELGIHAMWGNSFRDRQNRLHYSIGIEVLGFYDHLKWPPEVARLVGHAVAVLKRRLGTFDLRYLYPNGNPGFFLDDDGTAHCKHPEQLTFGGITSHRDYNKPGCPGAQISEAFYLDVLKAGQTALTTPAPAPVTTAGASATGTAAGGGAVAFVPDDSAPVSDDPITADSLLLGRASGRRMQVINFIKARLPATSEYKGDVETIVNFYWQYAPPAGIDPFLAAAQCVLETDALQSPLAARPQRNPARLGLRDPNAQSGGLAFATWELAVQAQLGHLLAYAVAAPANDAQRALLAQDPLLPSVPPADRGAGTTLAGLNTRWSDDPTYGARLAAQATFIKTTG